MSNGYFFRWNNTSKRWQLSTDGGSTFNDNVENPVHESVQFNAASAPTATADKGLIYYDGTNDILRLSENAGNFIEVNQRFTKGGLYVDVNGMSSAPGILYIWRAPFACTILAAYAHRQGGTGATVNAQNAGNDIRSGDLSLTTTNWTDFGTLQNTAMSTGSSLSIEIATVSGSPTQIGFTIHLRRTDQ
jgi:hypothetical protein